MPLPLDDFAATRLDLLEDVAQLLAEEDRDDGGRGLVGTQAVVVAGMGNHGSQQRRVLVHGPDHRGTEDEELHVGVRRAARVQAGFPGWSCQRPVDVLAGAVDAGERFFVQQAGHAVLLGDATERDHHDLLMVGGDIRGLEHRGNFILGRGHLVVTGLDRHAELEEFPLGFEHEGQHPFGNRAEVMVLELLALGRLGAEQRPTGGVQVGPREVEVAVDEEVLLLRSGGR